MLFTIAIPTYNNENTIEETIISAINQDYNNEYEILVVNNASTDKTQVILNKFKKEIRIITNERTVSMYENHNICLMKAKGDYILFCHSDDILNNNALKILKNVINKRLMPKKYVVWGRSFFRDFGKNFLHSSVGLNNVLAGKSSLVPFYYGGLTPSGTCYSREAFLQTGGFIKSNTKLAPSDMSTMLFLACNGFEFEMIDRLLFKRTEATTATSNNYLDYLDSIIDTLKELHKKLNKQEWGLIVENSFNLSTDPILFHSAILQITNNKKLMKYYIKMLIKKPKTFLLILFRQDYRYLFKNIVIKFIRRR